MKNNIILLSVDKLKENSIIDYNVEDKILESSIIDAQNIDIQYIIGSALYNEILNLVETGNITSGSTEIIDIKYLLDDFISPTLLKYSLYRSVLPMRISFRNKGLMENNSDNSQPVDKEFITYIENKFLNDCEFYSNKLKAYLCDFFVKYPDFDCDTTRSDYTTPNKNNSYFCGIQL